MLYSVGQLAKAFSISRTTLLYYDSLGLLRPSERSAAGYRLYDQTDYERLERIMIFRAMGIPLEEIKSLLTENGNGIAAMLLKQLGAVNLQIEALRNRQREIIAYLQKVNALFQAGSDLNVAELELNFKKAGITRETAQRWHRDFEKASPEEHQQLLELLGFSSAEQTEIIAMAREKKPQAEPNDVI